MLPANETATRIKAARLVRGMSQRELAGRLQEAGLPWRLAGKLERGEQPMASAHRAALAEALGFPERWFTAPVDELFAEPAPSAIIERLNKIVSLLENVR